MAELNGFQRMAEEWLNRGIRRIYTTDEFEAALCVMYERLCEAGIVSENRSHGVATYGPFVCYDLFLCHTPGQIEFYSQRGSVREFELKSFDRSNFHSNSPLYNEFRPVFIYLMGNWRQAGKKYEAELELTAIEHVIQAARVAGIPVLLKAHPNAMRTEMRKLERRFSSDIVRDLPELADRHPVYLTLLSSAYFDFLGRGPIFVCTNQLLHPELMFGKGVKTLDLDQDSSQLQQFTDPQHWIESLQAQRLKMDALCHASDNKTIVKSWTP